MAATIKIIISSESAGSALKDTTADVQKLGQTAKDSGAGFSSLREIGVGALREIGSLAVDALGKAAQAVGGFLRDSISAAGDFEAGMNNFKAVIGDAVDTKGLDQFKSLFISLGKELPVSTSEVQAAAIEMVKGGIDPATIAAGGLKQNLMFAAAAGLGLEEAATVSAKVLGGWTSQAASAADKAAFLTAATDTLTKAANASTVDVSDLALGLYNVQGTAKTTGLSLQETTTALAELAPRFSSANTAGTSFRNFLVRLQPTTKPAKEAMMDLGLWTKETGSAFFDAQGKFIGVAQASDLLRKALGPLTDAQRVQALQQIFGNDAMNAAAAFAEMGAEGYSDMAAAMDTAAGVQQNATTKQQGFNVALDNAKGSVEALQITVGTYLLPILTELINNVIAPAINQFTTLADVLGGNTEAFNQLWPPLQQIALSLQPVIAGFGAGGLAGGLAAVVAQINVLVPGFAGIVTAMAGFLPALQPLIDLIGANLQPILIALAGVLGVVVVGAIASAVAAFVSVAAPIVALIAVGAALYAAWNSNFLGIQTLVTSVITAVWGVIQAILPIITAFWAQNGAQIMATATQVWTTIQAIVSTQIEILRTVVVAVLTFVSGFIQNHGAAIVGYLTAAWNVISSIITTALNLIKGIVTAALQLLQGDFSGAWETIKSTTASFVAGLLSIVKNALDMLKAAFNLTLDLIKDLFHAFAGDAKGLGSGIVDGIIEGVRSAGNGLINFLRDLAKSALDAAKSALGIGSPSTVFADLVGKPIVQGIVKGIKDSAPDLHDTITKLAGDATKTAQKAFQPIGDVTKAAFKVGAVGGLAPIPPRFTTPNLVARDPLTDVRTFMGGGAGRSATYNNAKNTTVHYNPHYALPAEPGHDAAIIHSLAAV